MGRDTCAIKSPGVRNATPELFKVEFVVESLGAAMYDFADRMIECTRRLVGFHRPRGGGIAEIRTLALNRHPGGGLIWLHPSSSSMSSPRGYWRRNIIPRVEESAGEVGRIVAIGEIVGGKKAKNLTLLM